MKNIYREVQIISSHTYVIDKGTNGVRVGMSQLVASMLESLLKMWKLRIPPHYVSLKFSFSLNFVKVLIFSAFYTLSRDYRNYALDQKLYRRC